MCHVHMRFFLYSRGKPGVFNTPLVLVSIMGFLGHLPVVVEFTVTEEASSVVRRKKRLIKKESLRVNFIGC